jgi:hypothetical protein
MLRGAKPLSYFGYIEGQEVDCVVRYLRLFDLHVEAGRFGRREKITPVPQLPQLSHHRIFYTLPAEGWRVDAMLELLDRPGDWTYERERQFGSLLGYEDWQNDVWLGLLLRRADA